LANGASASPHAAWKVCKTPPAPAGPGAFPPSLRLEVIAIASSQPADHQNTASRYSLDDLARTLVNEAHAQAIHRSTIWRVLNAADLKPHRSVYWLNSHDPDFSDKAQAICELYLQAPAFYQQGRLVLSCDEKTGMQILGRPDPTQPARPGHPEKRENDYLRLGTRALIASFCVPTGEVVWDLGPTRTSLDFAHHVLRTALHFPDMQRFDWVVDNLNTHYSLDLCRVVASLCGVPFEPKALGSGAQRLTFLKEPAHKHRFHYVPRHGSWLNQVELFFSVLSRRFLRRGDFRSVAEFEERLRLYLDQYNQEQAHPYRWTYTGEPLVRATPFSQTKRQRRQGRTWFSTRPPLYERLLHPLRPYRRKAEPLAANL
jgi:hypothetical protein